VARASPPAQPRIATLGPSPASPSGQASGLEEQLPIPWQKSIMELPFSHFYETIHFWRWYCISDNFSSDLRIAPRERTNLQVNWNNLDMMSHDEFVTGYEKGSLGCSVSVLLTLRLFLAGKIREKKFLMNLLLWLLGLLPLIAASVVEFLKLPFIWALLCTAVSLAFYACAFFYSFGALVLSTALANEDIYNVATAKRALWIYSDDEKNLPRLENDRK
jgi:hypothetical protein